MVKRKKNVSWFFRWAAILAVVLSVLTWVSVSDAEEKDDALIISMDRAYAPLTFVNSFGRPSGLLVDLWRTWAEKSGRKIKFRVSSWSETLEALKNGDADFHSGLSFSKEREKWIGFSTQIYATFARVYHRVGDPQPVGIGGYGTDGVGVMSGSYQEMKFREAYPDVKTLSLVTTDDLINALLKSEVRAIIQEETIMGAALDRLGLHGDITSRSERLFPSTIHAGVLKKNTDLLQEIDKGLTLIPKSKLVEMEKRWTHNPEDRYYQPEAKSFKLSDDEKAWLAEHPNISVAINNAWPPMDFVTESGIPRGIGVDFVKALNKRIGGRLTIVPGSWADIYEQVKNRQLDALMDITPRENRKPYFNFTKPYASIPHVIIARKDGPYFGSIESLSGKTIALERGFYSVKFLKENHPNIRIKEYASTSDALYAVAKEEADAYAGNRAVASYLMEKELLGNLQFQGKLKVTASVNSIGVRKDWPKLAQILDRAIDSMTRDEVRAIYKKWGGIGDDEYSEWIGLTTDEKTWLKAHPVIRVHNEKAWPPFNFFENGTPKGFSIDYMNLLASRLGIEIQYITGPTWNEFINMVKNNELDIMLNIARSPERETFLDFTHEPYVTLMQALYTRDDQPLISSIEDLYGKTFAMPKGFYLQEILKKYPKIKIHEVSNTTEAIRAVSIGKADVMFDLMPVVNYITDRLQVTNLKVGGDIGITEGKQIPLYIGMRKDLAPLSRILEKTMKTVTKDDLRELQEKWLELTKKSGPVLSLTPEESAWLVTHPKIRLGVDPAFPPFEFIGKGGAHLGMASDYLTLINERLGIDMRIVPGLTWTQVIEKVKKHEVDALPAITNTEGRRAYLNFTQPYITFPFTFWSHKDQPPITGFEDLVGKKLAMVKEYFYVEHVLKNHPEIQPYFVDTPLEALKAVSRGKANAFIGNLAVAAYLVQRNNLVDLQMDSDVELELDGLCYGIRKDWPEFVSILDKAIESISQEKHREIRDRWVGVVFKKVELTVQEKEWLKAHPRIRVQNELDWPPFNFNEDGKPKGFSIAYMNLLAKKLGIEAEYVSGPSWGEFLDLIRDKDLDVMLNIIKTEDRSKYINFTEPYVEDHPVIIARIDNTSILDFRSLFGKTVAIPKGFFYQELIERNFPQIKLMLLKDQVESLKAVAFGKADATVGGINIQNCLIRQNMLNNLKVASGLPGEIFSNRLRIGVRDDWPELTAILQKAIDSISEQEYSGLSDQWISTIKEAEPGSLTEEEQSWLADHGKMRLGIASTWAPFEFFDANGVFSGVSSDYVRILTKWLGVTLTPQEGLTWAEVLEKARNKEIDVISAIVQTPERSEYLHFTKPYISLPMMVVTREDSPYIQGIKDLKDKTIAVVREYVTQGYLEEDHPDQKLLLLDSLEDVLTAVSEGRADALVENIAVANFVSKKLGITNLRAAAATPYFFELSYGVRKDWPELMPILEKALAAFSDQEKGLILDKWLNVQVEKRTDWKIVWLIIVIGTFVAGSILSVILVWNRRLSREVGERKRAEERFQTIAATTSGAIIQTRFDAEGRPEYLYLSAKAEEFFGMPPDQVIQGKQRLPWYHGDQKRIHEEIRTISSAGGDMNLVGRIQPAEGEIKWIRINASPSHSPEGGVIYNGFILDITERKLAEQEFIKSERKNKAMSQAVDDALVMINGKGKVMFWNQAAVNLFGYTAEEAMGMDFHKMAVPEAERVKSMAGLERFSRTGEGAVIGSGLQVRAKNRKGEEFPVEVSISAFQVDDEWFAVGTVRDITDRKKAEEELQQNLEDLERFSSMVIGREEKMIQLKEEINELLIQSGKGEKYKIVQ